MAVTIDKIQLLHGLESDWQRINPILLKGEPGVVLDNTTQIPLYLKIGNGVLPFNELPVVGGGGSTIIDGEPIYTKEQVDNLLAIINQQLTSLEGVDTQLQQDLTTSTDQLTQSLTENIENISNLLSESASQINKHQTRLEVIDIAKEYSKARYIYASTTGQEFESQEAISQGPYYHGATLITPDNLRDRDITTIGNIRYIYIRGKGFIYDGYVTPFTPEQQAAIDSGITTQKIADIDSDITQLEQGLSQAQSGLAEQVSTLQQTDQNLQTTLSQVNAKISYLAGPEDRAPSTSQVQNMITNYFSLTPAQQAAIDSGITEAILQDIQDETFDVYIVSPIVKTAGAGYKKYAQVIIRETPQSPGIYAFITSIGNNGEIQSLYIPPQLASFSPTTQSYPIQQLEGSIITTATCTLSEHKQPDRYTTQKYIAEIVDQLFYLSRSDSLTNKIADDFLYVIKRGIPTRIPKFANEIYVNKSYAGDSDGTHIAPYKTIAEALQSISETTKSIKINVAASELYSITNPITISTESALNITIEGAGADLTRINNFPIITNNELSITFRNLRLSGFTHQPQNTEKVSVVTYDNCKLLGTNIFEDKHIYNINHSVIDQTITLQNGSTLNMTNTDFSGTMLTIAAGATATLRNCLGGSVRVQGGSYAQYDTTLKPASTGTNVLFAEYETAEVYLYSGQCLTNTNIPARIYINQNVKYLLGTTLYAKTSQISSLAVKIEGTQLRTDQVIAGTATYGSTETTSELLENHLASISTALTNLSTLISAKYSKPAEGIPLDDLSLAIKTTLSKAENKDNKKTLIENTSNTETYPTVKAVYDALEAKTQNLASKDYVTTAIQTGLATRLLTPVEDTSSNPTASHWASWEALTTKTPMPTYYYKGQVVTLQDGDEAIYIDGENGTKKAKYQYDSQTEEGNWITIASISVDLATKQDKLSGTPGKLLTYTDTQGNITETTISHEVGNPNNHTTVPSEKAVRDLISGYQPVIPARTDWNDYNQQFLGEPYILQQPNTEGGNPNTVPIATDFSFLPETYQEDIEYSIPTSQAVKEKLDNKQDKLYNYDLTNSVLTMEGTSGDINYTRLYGSNEDAPDSNTTSIPTTNKVEQMLEDYIKGDDIHTDPINAQTVGGIYITTVPSVSTVYNSTDALYQRKIVKSDIPDKSQLLAVKSTADGDIEKRNIIETIEEMQEGQTKDIPTVGAVRAWTENLAAEVLADDYQKKSEYIGLENKLLSPTEQDGTYTLKGRGVTSSISEEPITQQDDERKTQIPTAEATYNLTKSFSARIDINTSNDNSSKTLKSNKNYHATYINGDKYDIETRKYIIFTAPTSSEEVFENITLTRAGTTRDDKTYIRFATNTDPDTQIYLNLVNSDLAIYIESNTPTININLRNSSLRILTEYTEQKIVNLALENSTLYIDNIPATTYIDNIPTTTQPPLPFNLTKVYNSKIFAGKYIQLVEQGADDVYQRTTSWDSASQIHLTANTAQLKMYTCYDPEDEEDLQLSERGNSNNPIIYLYANDTYHAMITNLAGTKSFTNDSALRIINVYDTNATNNLKASSLNTSAGSTTQPIYIDTDGIPKAITGLGDETVLGTTNDPAGPTTNRKIVDIFEANSNKVKYASSATVASFAEQLRATLDKGSSTKPIYFTGGIPAQCGNSLEVSITGNADTATRAKYYTTSANEQSLKTIEATVGTLQSNIDSKHPKFTWPDDTEEADKPKAPGTAATGSASRAARMDHIHPLQDTLSEHSVLGTPGTGTSGTRKIKDIFVEKSNTVYRASQADTSLKANRLGSEGVPASANKIVKGDGTAYGDIGFGRNQGQPNKPIWLNEGIPEAVTRPLDIDITGQADRAIYASNYDNTSGTIKEEFNNRYTKTEVDSKLNLVLKATYSLSTGVLTLTNVIVD